MGYDTKKNNFIYICGRVKTDVDIPDRRLGNMAIYGIDATRAAQKRLHDAAERNNIRRLQKRADTAIAELVEAQLRQVDRIMSEEERIMKKGIREGSHVKILGNAKGTCWETGYVADINPENEALINFGTKDFPVYGMGIRRQLSELEVI